MASEIRVNKINNRAGLGTVEYTPTGIIVSGIVTAYEFDGNFDTTPGIVITGIGTAQSLDVDDFVDVGNIIKLGNAGVVTATTFSTANVDVTTDKIVVGTGITIEANQVATGQATFTGIVTASSFSGDGSSLTGIAATTNVRTNSLEVSGVSTFSGNANFTNPVSFGGDSLADVEFKNGNNTRVRFDVTENGLVFLSNSYLYFDQNGTVIYRTGQDTRMWTQDTSKNLSFGTNTEKLEVNNAGVNVAGIVTATSFSGDGSSLSNLPAGAPVGGASTNTVFFENDVAVAVNYQVTTNKNAMSAGPIAINAGIAVTVPSGSSWTIV